MTNLLRLRTVLTGFPGGPGVATMYFLDASTAVESVSKFWTTIAPAMPNDVHIAPERSGDTIEDTTGALTGSWLGGVVTPSSGGGAGIYAAPVGALVTWLTTTVLDRKRVRGRTFIVPCNSTIFETNGAIALGARQVFEAAAAQLIVEQSASFVIWHRPFKGSVATPTRPARPAHGGGHGLVTSMRVPTKATVLRSRRD